MEMFIQENVILYNIVTVKHHNGNSEDFSVKHPNLNFLMSSKHTGHWYMMSYKTRVQMKCFFQKVMCCI